MQRPLMPTTMDSLRPEDLGPGAPSPAALRSACKDKLEEELGAVMHDPEHPISSLSVLAMRAGRVVYEGQFGHRHLDSSDPAKNLPVDKDTLFRVASISKMVAAIGFMKLVEGGQIGLDTDVDSYLGFPLRNLAFPDRAITPRMLLSHTSSLRDGDAKVYVYDATTSLASVLSPSGAHYDAGHWATGDAGIGMAPGEFFAYTNLNWGVLATLMEKVSGKRFGRYMQDEVLGPLGLHGGYNPSALAASEIENLATLYRKKDAEGRWDPAAPWTPQGPDRTGVPAKPVDNLETYVVGSNGTLFSPQGGLRISVRDLGRIMQMFLQGGTYGGVPLLEASTVALMSSEQWRHDGEVQNGDPYGGQMRSWGLGLQRFTDARKGDRLVEPGGFTGWGHLAEAYGLVGGFVLDPASGSGAIYLIGGTGCDPDAHPGQYSAFSRWEERILTSLYVRAIQGT